MHSSFDLQMGCFYILTVVKSGIISMSMQVSLLYNDFDSFGGYIPKNGVVGSYGSSVPYLFKESSY